MTDINATLTTLINNATSDLDTLNALIQELGSGTPVADVGEQPTFDSVAQKWTFAQTTANDNGEFLGVYKLTSELFCALLQALDIIAFSAPQAPNTPARILPCGADPLSGWVGLPALVDLEGQEVNQFSIRSATA